MIALDVTEASQVADARRKAVGIGHQLGFDDTAAGRVAIGVTELATNLVKYGAGGEMLLGAYEDQGGVGVEVIALDRGPGLGSITEALRDGHSTGGSGGTGLGAIRRQSRTFDILSWPGRGTAILSRIAAAPGTARDLPPAMFGGVAVPLRGESVCGDAYATHATASGWTVMVADGLGHGPQAAQASQEAVRLFRQHADAAPSEILTAVHAGLRATRGGAVSVARYEDRGTLAFAGIGNVTGAIVAGGEVRRMVSLPGTVGHVARRIQTFEYPVPAGGVVILCSDGIGTSWSLDRHPGLLGAHPSLIAAVLYRDFARGRDDATVLVVQGDLT